MGFSIIYYTQGRYYKAIKITVKVLKLRYEVEHPIMIDEVERNLDWGSLRNVLLVRLIFLLDLAVTRYLDEILCRQLDGYVCKVRGGPAPKEVQMPLVRSASSSLGLGMSSDLPESSTSPLWFIC